MSYDPNYFLLREDWLTNTREKIASGNYDKSWKDLLIELTDYYEDYLETLRVYEDCFNEKQKKKLKRTVDIAARKFIKAVSKVQQVFNE